MTQQLLPLPLGQWGNATLSQTPPLPHLSSPAPTARPPARLGHDQQLCIPRRCAAEEGSISAARPARWEAACVAALRSHLPARGWPGAAQHQHGHGAAAGTRCLLLSFFSFLPPPRPSKQKQRGFWGCGWAGHRLFSLKDQGWISHSKTSVPPSPSPQRHSRGLLGSTCWLHKPTKELKTIPSQLSITSVEHVLLHKAACTLL